ncbi:sulfatase [Thalassoglobus sp. JC818]|uniref:sulfatase n=1 Tax=Thalassoglobus sp. JC818 TaxID=3232136 RepID=UPI0034598974
MIARDLRRVCWMGLLVLTVFSPVRAAEPDSANDRPNVLFIAIDDLNDWEGCLGGHPQAKTPYMDRLAERGTLFSNAHCQAPLCNSSRTAIMTGLRPSSTGVYALQPWFRKVEELRDHVTLPQHFKSQGYKTLTAGKIYHGGFPPKPERTAEFDVWGPSAGVGVRPPEKLVTTPGGNHPLVDWGTFPHRDEDKGDWKVASWAVEQLEQPQEEPFFLSVGFFLPHVPCYATQKWFDLYPEDELIMPEVPEGDRSDVPHFSWYLYWKLPEVRLSWLKETGQWKPLVRAYLASVSFVDSQVGRVLDALEASGHADDTIVVLWSDHGWHLGEKDISGKNTLWHESTRVPLIFAGPGIQSGEICSQPAELIDMYPTLAELCGLPAPEGLDGHSLVPQLEDVTTARQWPAITTHNPGNHSVVTDRWRYIHYADGSEELYDLKSDPNEWTNLATSAAHAQTKSELAKLYPRNDASPAPGSKSRLLIKEGDQWLWEGEPIIDSELER